MTMLKARTARREVRTGRSAVPNRAQAVQDKIPKSRLSADLDRDVPGIGGDRRIGGDGADHHDPALGVDPLEHGRAPEGHRPAAVVLLRRRRLGHRDMGGEIDQVGDPGIFQDGLQHRIGDEDGPEPEADRADHEGEADGDPHDVRDGRAEAVSQPRRQQHDVVRPRREEHHGGEHDEGDQERMRHGASRDLWQNLFF